MPGQVRAVLGKMGLQAARQDDSHRLRHQRVQRRPDFDGALIGFDPVHGAEAIGAGPQLGLQLRFDLRPAGWIG